MIVFGQCPRRPSWKSVRGYTNPWSARNCGVYSWGGNTPSPFHTLWCPRRLGVESLCRALALNRGDATARWRSLQRSVRQTARLPICCDCCPSLDTVSSPRSNNFHTPGSISQTSKGRTNHFAYSGWGVNFEGTRGLVPPIILFRAMSPIIGRLLSFYEISDRFP